MDVFERIADWFIRNEVIPLKDKDIYTYGLKQGSLMVLNIGTTIIIGIILKMVWQSIILMLAYIPLRTYAGGYHAVTQFRCYIYSIGIVLGALLGIRLIPWTNFICFVVALFVGSIIFLLAPVEDSNKPLNQVEIIIYRNKARVLLSILLAGALLFCFLGQKQITICIIMAIILCAVMLVCGVLKKSDNERRKVQMNNNVLTELEEIIEIN